MKKVYLPQIPLKKSTDFKVHSEANSLPAYQFHLLQKFSDQVSHAVFTRNGGVSEGAFATLNVRFGIGDKNENVKENRVLMGECFGLENGDFISANQTHSNHVQIIDDEHARFLHNNHDFFDDVDGFVTASKNVPLMIQMADCQAILMYDSTKNIIAAVHAGWKGLVKDISGEALKIMSKNFGVRPENVLVGISPSLGPCCSFFSDPEKELPQNFHRFIDKSKRVNLWNFSVEQLLSHGVERNNIELARICTQCGGDGTSLQKQNLLNSTWKNPFFSFRGQQGITGRFAAVISL